ncbi:MAG: hypothetical protein ACLQVX_04480 [Limisphaerales bacterium]
MNTLMQQWLQGRKTYLTCLAVGVLLFGSWQKWWQLPPEIYAGLATLALTFLRAGIAKIESSQGDAAAAAPASAPATAPVGSKGSGTLGVMAGTLIAGGAIGASLMLAGCGTLDPAGVYQGNQALYQTDVALASSYEVLHGFVQWEYDNRAALSSTPEIKAAADRVRSGAPQWFASALALRDAWQTNPSSTNQTSLEQSLAVIQQATAQAIGCMATNSTGLTAQSAVQSSQPAAQTSQPAVQAPKAAVQSAQPAAH